MREIKHGTGHGTKGLGSTAEAAQTPVLPNY